MFVLIRNTEDEDVRYIELIGTFNTFADAHKTMENEIRDTYHKVKADDEENGCECIAHYKVSDFTGEFKDGAYFDDEYREWYFIIDADNPKTFDY